MTRTPKTLASKRFYFIGYRGAGTWPLELVIESTDAFNAVLEAHNRGWHRLTLMAEIGAQECARKVLP